jgi:hypothetical protein
MKFGEALSYLEDGKCVSRNIWKAGEFIEKATISHTMMVSGKKVTTSEVVILHNFREAFVVSGESHREITCEIWEPKFSDLFADDWFVAIVCD